MIKILANGEPHRIQRATTLTDFLLSKDLSPDRVVVEYNSSPLTRAEAREITLNDGDCLEIIRIVAGG